MMRLMLIRLVRLLPLLIALTVLAVLLLTVPAFSRGRYWLTLPVQYFTAAALALALTPVILTGGIDLSVGSIMVLASVVTAVLWRKFGVGIEVALVAGVLAGGLCGLLNGALVVRGVLPLVVTLATRELFRGLALSLTGGVTIGGMSAVVSNWLGARLFGLPGALWVLLGLAAVSYLVVHHTWVGRALFAIGDNERAARFAALPVDRIQLWLYVWAGVVAGLCGAALVVRYGSVKADAEKSWELLAVACVVMGGVRVTGGAGHVAGVLLGTLTVCMLLAGLGNVASDWRDTVCGVVLIGMALVSEAGARWLARQGPVTQSREVEARKA